MSRSRPPIVAILAFATVAALFFSEGCDINGADGSVASPSLGTKFGGVSRGPADASVAPAQCVGLLPPSSRFDAETCPPAEAEASPCDGLGCAVERRCEAGVRTTVSGTLYDPAGRNPVANAIVFVPVDPLGRLATIASGTPACGKCAVFVPGEIVTIGLTDAAGHFSLPDAPSGADIPLVFQVGKWRREILLPEVRSCADTVVPAASSRLPRNQDEGDIPQFALLAGGCDRLACFMRDVGLDASEFTGPAEHGRVHVYQGAGPGPLLSGGAPGDCTGGDAGACPLWSTKQQLEKYDALLLGCECGENAQTKTDMLPLHEWLNTGGNVFAIHSQRTWFKNSPDRSREVANWTDGASSRPFNADVSFTDGQIFHDWLAATNVLGPDGSLLLDPAQVSTSVASVNSSATPWVAGDVRSVDPGGAAPSRGVSAFSFLAPVGGKPSTAAVPTRSFCGRAVFTDIHPGGADVVDTAAVPASCPGGEMSAEEKALEFLLFDLTNCLTPFLYNKQGTPPALSAM